MPGNEVKIIVRALDKASGTTDKIAGKLSGPLKAGAIGAATAMAGLGIAGVKMGMDFEKGMAEVFTLLPKLSKEGFGKLKDDVLDFSKEMGISTDQVVPALYQAISAGVPPENVIDFLRVGAKSSIGGVTELSTAVDGLTSVTNAWGLQTEESGRVADAMFTAVRLGKTTFGELASSISTVAPLASALDVSLEEVFASAATLTKSGMETAEAMTDIRSAMVALQRTTPAMEEALSNLGFATGDALLKSKGFQGAMVLLREEADRMGLPLIELFGRIQGVQAVLGLTGDKAATAKQDFGAFGDEVSDVDEAFQKMEETASRQLERAMNDLRVEITELGVVALPGLIKSIHGATKAIEGITAVGGPIVRVIGDIASATDTASDAFDSFLETVSFSGSSWAEIKEAAKKAGEETHFWNEALLATAERFRDLNSAAGAAATEGLDDLGQAVDDAKTPLQELQDEADDTRDALFRMFTEPTQEEAQAEAALAAYKYEAHKLETQSGDLTAAEQDRLDQLKNDLIPTQEEALDGINLARDAEEKYTRLLFGDLPTHQEWVDKIRGQAGALGEVDEKISDMHRRQVFQALANVISRLKDQFGFADANARDLLTTIGRFGETNVADIAAAVSHTVGPVPSRQAGGAVPGLPGQPQLIMAHGGERVITQTEDEERGEGMTVFVEQLIVQGPIGPALAELGVNLRA